MKILMVAGPFISLREPFGGGTEAFIVHLANALVRLGHAVDVLAKDADEKNLFRVVEFPESPLSMKDDSYRACPEWLGQQHFQTLQLCALDVSSYDVIHYNSFIPEIYSVGTLLNIPSVLTLHLPPSGKFALIYKFFVKHTNASVVAVSRRMGDRWKPVLNKSIEIILNGIAADRWKVREKNPDGYLLWSGRITEEKNITAAIRLAKFIGKPLKIIGPVFNQKYFDEHIVPHLDHSTEYIPHATQTQLNTFAEGASAYLVTASWEEPFGLSTVEMLASGLPVVGFSTAIPPELRQDGICVAVDSQDWRDLILPLETVSKSTPEKCRSFAIHFDIERTAANYAELFRSIKNKN